MHMWLVGEILLVHWATLPRVLSGGRGNVLEFRSCWLPSLGNTIGFWQDQSNTSHDIILPDCGDQR